MTDRNYTCVASAMQSSKQNPIKVGDTFITNQGCLAVVLLYHSALKILVEFQDKYKHRALVRAEHLRSGNIRNPYFPSVYGVGYIGVGEYLTKKNGKKTFVYSIWHAMIQRCYDKSCQAKNPTYKGCAVSEEWLNFQNFAKWYTSQEHCNSGYQIDKDILVAGNKVYSPSTCVLAPREINNLFLDSGAARGSLPIGVYYQKRNNKFIARLNICGKKKHIGSFENPTDAYIAYDAAKKQYIFDTALKWRDLIDKKLFEALMQRAK